MHQNDFFFFFLIIRQENSEPWCGINYINFLFTKIMDAVTFKAKNTLQLWGEGRVRVLMPHKDNLLVTDQNSCNALSSKATKKKKIPTVFGKGYS